MADPLQGISAVNAAMADHEASGLVVVRAELQGTAIDLATKAGATVAQGQQLAVFDSMKMEHPVLSPVSGVIREEIHFRRG